MPGAIVILNGYPAVGKSTVAQELTKILPNAKIVDIPLLEEIACVLEGPARETLKKSLLETLLISLLSSTPTNTIYLIPSTFLSIPSDRQLINLFPSLCSEKSWPVIHLVLSCETQTNLSRLSTSLSHKPHDPTQNGKQSSSHDLTQNGNGSGNQSKHGRWEMNENSLMELRMEDEICHLINLRGKPKGLSGEYEIDTTTLGPKEVSGMVAEYVMDCLRRSGWYVQLKRR
ncbi:hypothetical protein M231_07876 [Tremella mesenterica]|uniref:Uncharacterized protein n=2 Tax=Tremella mesenterica TaxID=5217 RepID=A0A4Q1B815_TREME|nr:hypothetical protein M231_07876 [Tremella mesenterica]